MTKSTIRASLSALALAAAALGSTPVAAQAVEPQTQSFLNSIAGGAPIYTLPVPDARGVLVAVQQSVPVTLAPASVEDRVLPIGPTGETSIRIYRPEGATETLPVIVYAHGGGWVLGDKFTHERLRQCRQRHRRSQSALLPGQSGRKTPLETADRRVPIATLANPGGQ